MRKCSLDEKEEAVSRAMEEILSRALAGRAYPFAYWVGFLRNEGLLVHYKKRDVSLDEQPEGFLDWLGRSARARADTIVEARQALELCLLLPKKHKSVILRRADGANPGEIAQELQMDITEVLMTLDEARVWIEGMYA